jgi:hypothetical protein
MGHTGGLVAVDVGKMTATDKSTTPEQPVCLLLDVFSCRQGRKQHQQLLFRAIGRPLPLQHVRPNRAQKMGRALGRCRPKAQGTWLGRGSVDWVKEDTSRVLQLQGVLAGEQPSFLEPSHSFHSSGEQPVYQTANLAFTTVGWMPDHFGS